MGLTEYNIDGNNGEQGVIGTDGSDAKSLLHAKMLKWLAFLLQELTVKVRQKLYSSIKIPLQLLPLMAPLIK